VVAGHDGHVAVRSNAPCGQFLDASDEDRGNNPVGAGRQARQRVGYDGWIVLAVDDCDVTDGATSGS
jgi:hypothetical protein